MKIRFFLICLFSIIFLTLSACAKLPVDTNVPTERSDQSIHHQTDEDNDDMERMD